MVATVAAGAFPQVAPARAAETPAIERYRPLGRTGLRISDISFGASRTTDPSLVRHAFDRGVNYFDTAEGYRGGRSEEAVGDALHSRRDRVILASKVFAKANADRAELMHRLEGSLRRLRTDHIDVYFNHAVNDVARLRNDEWFAFAERAKRQGKIRFTGMSGHGGRLAECLDHALDGDLVDVILVAYNFGQDPAFHQRFTKSFDFVAVQPELPRLLAKAHGKGVGVIAMKTLMGARLNDMRPHERDGATFAQAAFRWVLSDPNVDALIISMKQRALIDEFVAASGKTPDAADVHLLERYLALVSATWCRPACDACTGSCPHGVSIPDVLRARMYAVDYRDRELADDAYAALANLGLGMGASPCLQCTAQPCLGSCPFALDIPSLTRETARLLG